MDGAADGGTAPGRIVVVSAAIGAGHDSAARELGRRLSALGFRVDHADLLDQLPWRLGRLVFHTYKGMVNRAPWSYEALYRVTDRFPAAVPLMRALLRPLHRRLRRLIPADTRAVVATYPFAGQVLGPMRRTGRLTVPVVTYITDFSVHSTWVCPWVDVHCAAHPLTGARARALGAADVRVVDPLVSDRFRPVPAAAKRRARERFGLPADARLALVVGGSWGLGDLASSAADIGATRAAEPVVVCGRNTRLYRRLRRGAATGAGGHVLGWVDDVAALMRTADVVVENGGGMSSREAMVAGIPVASYRPLPGHGRASASVMAGAGVAAWIRRPDALRATLTDLIDGADGHRVRSAGLALPDTDTAALVADAAAGAEPAGPPAPNRAGALRAASLLAGAAALVVANRRRARLAAERHPPGRASAW
ncbi:MGDG synthase family glycosyltransferase [Rhizomonospora bruguierae]|uniref:MGDG synthase family glycosyltransferase n=1 Tax=Rhizomonospora bruguierae TaxID=1581705 RepID=UPI001BCFC979|nr:UDP-N-acetylglucosamine--LPS N-acetylglucosamine transferase [Micromonospora sp. NBRC 107566]